MVEQEIQGYGRIGDTIKVMVEQEIQGYGRIGDTRLWQNRRYKVMVEQEIEGYGMGCGRVCLKKKLNTCNNF